MNFILELEYEEEVKLVLCKDYRNKTLSNIYISPLQEQNDQAEASLRIKVKNEPHSTFDIPVCKADQRFFPFQFRGDEQGDHHGLVR